MVFNSLEFVGFIILVGLVYFILNKPARLRMRNVFLLCASCLFYGMFNWWFLILLLYIIVVNYFGAILINKSEHHRKSWITVTIVLSLGILAFMKYAYMFEKSILLPVGLSFFTFQALAYSIDVYRRKIEVDKNFIDVALYISFLPTILSGPIERARNILPQLKTETPMNYDNISIGVRLFVWGLLKKVVIADRLAEYVNVVYATHSLQSGTTLALAAFFYSIQIYCDFSGYADMAIGTGRALGFKIMDNFRFPYFATSIKEFWRRWHISLTSWFTEYVYISLGGNRVTMLRWIFNIMAIFILSGIWHGATIGFLIWGAIHGVAYLIEFALKIDKKNAFYGLICFIVVTIAWIFFRIEDANVAMSVVGKIFTDFKSLPNITATGSTFSFMITIALLVLFAIREVIEYRKQSDRVLLSNIESVFALLIIALFGVSTAQFVYFQF